MIGAMEKNISQRSRFKMISTAVISFIFLEGFGKGIGRIIRSEIMNMMGRI